MKKGLKMTHKQKADRKKSMVSNAADKVMGKNYDN